MMNLKDIQSACAALGNQLAAGISMLDATSRMARAQPAHADFWQDVRNGVASGRALSSYLQGVWPDTFVSAIRAGEESGSLPSVLARIEDTVQLQRDLTKQVMQLAYPVLSGLLGLVVFVFFMVQVIPSLSSTLGVGERGFVFIVSAWMTATVEQYGIFILVVLAGAAVGAGYWCSEPVNRATIVDTVLRIPVIGDALKLISFGLWAHYMALIDSTGVPVTDGLKMTSSTLPVSLRQGMDQMADEAVVRGLADAADPDKQAEGDTRRAWPFYVSNAFLIAQETGRLDAELMRAAPAMLKEGKAKLAVALWFANTGALLLSALLIVGPLAAYYIQLGISLADAMKG
jgi:type II secretory pathway component PulF